MPADIPHGSEHEQRCGGEGQHPRPQRHAHHGDDDHGDAQLSARQTPACGREPEQGGVGGVLTRDQQPAERVEHDAQAGAEREQREGNADEHRVDAVVHRQALAHAGRRCGAAAAQRRGRLHPSILRRPEVLQKGAAPEPFPSPDEVAAVFAPGALLDARGGVRLDAP